MNDYNERSGRRARTHTHCILYHIYIKSRKIKRKKLRYNESMKLTIKILMVTVRILQFN